MVCISKAPEKRRSAAAAATARAQGLGLGTLQSQQALEETFQGLQDRVATNLRGSGLNSVQNDWHTQILH